MKLLQFKIRSRASFDEIHTYTEDLATVTHLRDKAHSVQERDRLTETIKVMQLVLQHLNNKL